MGKWFKRTGKRDQICLATKFGFIKGDKNYGVDSSGEYCKRACAESLKILDIDYIDLCKRPAVQKGRAEKSGAEMMPQVAFGSLVWW